MAFCMDGRDSWEGGKTSHTGAAEQQVQWEVMAVSQCSTHRGGLRVSRTTPLLRHLKAGWLEGGGCLLCHSSKACFCTVARAICCVWPLERQCNMTRAVNVWKSPEGFWRRRPFLQFIHFSFFKLTCFWRFNPCCLQGFVYVYQSISPCLHPFANFSCVHWYPYHRKGRRESQYKLQGVMQLFSTET